MQDGERLTVDDVTLIYTAILINNDFHGRLCATTLLAYFYLFVCICDAAYTVAKMCKISL